MQHWGRPVGHRGSRNLSQGGHGQLDYPGQNTPNTTTWRRLKLRDRNVNPTMSGSNPQKTEFCSGDGPGPASPTAAPPSGAQREVTGHSAK